MQGSGQERGESNAMVLNMKAQIDSELSQMRNIISTRMSDDQMAQVKNKEKSTALFNETVRIGKDLERLQAQFSQNGVSGEVKMQSIEARLVKAEQDSASIQDLREMFVNAMNTFKENAESRLNQLETSLSYVTVNF